MKFVRDNMATQFAFVWKSNFRRSTPSTRRCPRNNLCSMAWRSTKVHAISLRIPYSLVDFSRRFAFFGLSSLLAPPEKSTNDQENQLVELSSSAALTVLPAQRLLAAASKVERDAKIASEKAKRLVKNLKKRRNLRQTNGPAKLQAAQVNACVVIKVPSIHVEVVL